MKKAFISVICCIIAIIFLVSCTPVINDVPEEVPDIKEEDTQDNAQDITEDMVIVEIDEELLSEEEEEEEAPYSNLKPYSKLWLYRYAPSSVAPLSEQVGDNGIYDEPTDLPKNDTYKLIVDYHNQVVWVVARDEFGDYNILTRVMICSTGGNGSWTPEGNYLTHDHKVRFGEFKSDDCFGQYWSQIFDRFYFHSLLYDERDASTWTKTSYNNLGSPASHGCVRLYVPDARWIYYNIAPGTQCIVTTEIEKNEYLKAAVKKGYDAASDVISKEEEFPAGYMWLVKSAHEKTFEKVLEIAKTMPPQEEEVTGS